MAVAGLLADAYSYSMQEKQLPILLLFKLMYLDSVVTRLFIKVFFFQLKSS